MNVRKGSTFVKGSHFPVNRGFLKGMRQGVPICLGYLSVSFGFGILAVKSGLSAMTSVLISMTNLTSAGQAAGVAIIASGGTLVEMALTQLVINLRYALMAMSLSQKLDSSFNTLHRMAASFGITDEIFAVAAAQEGLLTPAYMYGLILVSFLGWTAGTALGAAAGELLPAAIIDAMGIVLYGMFLAIIIPPARKMRSVLAVVLAAALLSTGFHFLLPAVSGGFVIIISAVAAAALGAALFPLRFEEEKEA